MYTLDAAGKRIYTLKKITASGAITKSAHPARFSPDDKWSRSVSIRQLFSGRQLILAFQAPCYSQAPLRTSSPPAECSVVSRLNQWVGYTSSTTNANLQLLYPFSLPAN